MTDTRSFWRQDTPSSWTPEYVRLESCTVCQLRCPSCPTAQGKVARHLGAGSLRLKDFCTFIEHNRVRHIELSNWGEPLLNPDLPDILVSAAASGVSVSISNGSNLNYLPEKLAELLVSTRVHSLTVSLDGTDQPVYELYRRGGKWERVRDNINLINHYKKKIGSAYPLLTWQFVVFGHNEHQISEVKRLAAEWGMEVYFKLSFDESFSPVRNADDVRREACLPSSSRSEFEETKGRPYHIYRFCSQLWSLPQINWDGRMLGCCINYQSDFGNVFESGLSEVFHGPLMRRARAMLTGDASATDGVPCTNCPYYQSIQRSRKWIRPESIVDFSEEFRYANG